MIAFLTGTTIRTDDDRVIVRGLELEIGYEVRVPHRHLSDDELAEKIGGNGLYIWHVIRQDDQELFGFWSLVDRQLAKKIADTDGIGPTSASKLVQTAGADAVVTAIVQQDAKLLARLCKGLGPKRAEKIIHHLKEYAEEQMQSMPAMVRIPVHRKTLIAKGLTGIGFTVDDQRLAQVLEANLELTDGQIIRKYIEVVRTL